MKVRYALAILMFMSLCVHLYFVRFLFFFRMTPYVRIGSIVVSSDWCGSLATGCTPQTNDHILTFLHVFSLPVILRIGFCD
jgi:hypothetical protein